MIVGVDVSSRRIDLAWLQDGKPCRWHQELAKGHLIDRLRSIRIQWPTDEPPMITSQNGFMTMTNINWQPGAGVTDVAIEYPYTVRKNAIAALMATTGIITRQAPPWARVAWPSSGELRAAIGARNTKTSAHIMLHARFQTLEEASGGIVLVTGKCSLLRDWDEHELDALVAAIGWTNILAAQDAA